MKTAQLLFHTRWIAPLLLFTAAAPAQVGTTLSAPDLRFAHQAGSSSTPGPQTVRVFSAPENLPFTAFVEGTTTPWLSVNNLTNGSVATGTTGTATQDIQIRVTPIGLQPGNYVGRVQTQVQGAGAIPITVNLTVNANPQLIITQGSLVFSARAGTASLINVPVTSTSGAQIPFTASTLYQVSPNSSPWLTVSASGQTGGQVTVTADATNLPAGLATGSLLFTANGGTVTLPVVLYVSAAATLSVSPTSTTIGYQVNTSPPGARQISVSTSDSSPAQYTAEVTSGTWLGLSTTAGATSGTTVVQNTTPNPFFVVANPAGLALGTYNGRVRISSAAIPGSTQEIDVQLIVSASPLLQAIPESLTFNYTVGTPVSSQQLSITTTSGTGLAYNIVPSTETGGEWLVASPVIGTTGTNPTLVTLNAVALSTLTAGTYKGRLTVNAPGTANSPFVVPVTLNVSGSTQISVTPNLLQFTTQLNSSTAPTAQTFTVASTDSTNRSFTLSVEPANATWLALSAPVQQTGTSGALVTVNVLPSALTEARVYEAFVVVTPTNVPNATPQRVQVRVTVNPEARITATPERLDFTQTGTTAPAVQTVTLTSNVVPRSFIASASQPWITLSATQGEIGPGGYALTVGVNPATLQPGVLEGEVRIVGSGANTISIPVRFSLNVSTLTATPIQLTYNYQLGAAAPAEQTITLASSNATPVTYTAAAATQTGGAWLSVTPASGSTATAPTLRVIVNPLQLAAGTYRGTITVTPTGQAGTQPTVINVTLNVTAPSAPVISTVLNAATNTPTSISPGLIIAIKGVNLGPATPLEGQVQNGFFTTERSGVRVLFDGSPAPVYYVSATQINAIAPYTIANRTTTRVAVEYLGQRSEALEFRVVESSPGLFTLSGTGSGQAAIVNLNGTINGTANPAQPGSVVILYGTGEGQTRPAGETGRIISQAADVRTPIGAVSVMIGGRPAEVLYAGSAGGLVSGAFQLNVRVPTDLGITGQTALPVTVRVGNATSASEQTNALILVRP